MSVLVRRPAGCNRPRAFSARTAAVVPYPRYAEASLVVNQPRAGTIWSPLSLNCIVIFSYGWNPSFESNAHRALTPGPMRRHCA